MPTTRFVSQPAILFYYRGAISDFTEAYEQFATDTQASHPHWFRGGGYLKAGQRPPIAIPHALISPIAPLHTTYAVTVIRLVTVTSDSSIYQSLSMASLWLLECHDIGLCLFRQCWQ